MVKVTSKLDVLYAMALAVPALFFLAFWVWWIVIGVVAVSPYTLLISLPLTFSLAMLGVWVSRGTR